MSDSTKNILIVTHHYPPHITGVGTVAYNQAKRLVALGHSVTIVTSDAGKNEKSCIQEGIRVIRIKALNISENWGAPFPIFSPRLLTVLLREVKKADIVHIHDAFYMSSFFAAVFARHYKKPLVLTEHIALIAHPSKIVVFVEKLVYATTGKIVFALSDSVIVYNVSVKKFLLSKKVPGKKIVMLMNGVDNEIFHSVTPEQKLALREKLGLSKYKKIILFVGRFVHKKGFTKVLAAASPKYQIALAGADALGENTPEVVYLGKMLPSQIAEVYQAADLFLLPSESEGFPLSIQEAMSCGLPIVTTDDEGYDEYKLDKTKVCLLGNPTDESVKKAVNEIIFDETRLEEMGSYSRNYADDFFDWNIIVSKLELIYMSLLQKKNAKKRKIAFVSDAIYHYNKGGKEKRLYDLSIRLAAEGHEVTIYCMKWWEGPTTIERDGVTFYAISPYYPLYSNNRRSIGQAILFSLNCFKLLNKSFDVMDVDHIPHLVLFVTKFVCFVRGKKMIATWHEVWGKKYWQQYLGTFAGTFAYWIEKISVTLPSKIISVSGHTTADLRNRLGVHKEIITIPNALDIDLIKESVPGSTSDIIFAGRLLPHKNVDVLLKAIFDIKKNNPELKAIIIGEGPQKEYLEQLSADLNLNDNVIFTGFIEKQDELYGTMKSSKVFVLPSDREGFGITVIEANAAGLPVVTIDTEHNAAKELIIDNKNGMLSSLNPVDLAVTIEEVLLARKTPEYYMTFAEKYSWKEIITALEKLYI